MKEKNEKILNNENKENVLEKKALTLWDLENWDPVGNQRREKQHMQYVFNRSENWPTFLVYFKDLNAKEDNIWATPFISFENSNISGQHMIYKVILDGSKNSYVRSFKISDNLSSEKFTFKQVWIDCSVKYILNYEKLKQQNIGLFIDPIGNIKPEYYKRINKIWKKSCNNNDNSLLNVVDIKNIVLKELSEKI